MSEKKEKYEYARLPLDEELQRLLSALPDSWEFSDAKGQKTKGENKRLRNLVEFAIQFWSYLKRSRISLPSPAGFDKFFALASWEDQSDNAILGGKLKELAILMNLPVPDSENISSWLSSLAERANLDELTGQIIQEKQEDLTPDTQVVNHFMEIINTEDITIKIDNKDSLNLFLKKLITIYYNYQNLVINLDNYEVPEPSSLNIQDWIKKYINPGKSHENSSHDLLEALIDMETLPSDEEMILLANKFNVHTRQLYRIYHMIHGHSDDSNITNASDG